MSTISLPNSNSSMPNYVCTATHLLYIYLSIIHLCCV